ncbi:MAG: beta-ketoacyl synthase chain length factor [Candidatus Competibacteraceae bacterium]|nr:beta-ketoacyl synthase chain length factor [Candidatus Competibacteraceae bacterium]
MTAVYLQSLSLAAPGLPGWSDSRLVLVGEQAYQAQPLAAFKPSLLRANERRRTTQVINLALQAAQEAMTEGSPTATQVGSVFASSGGDYAIIDKLCTALNLPGKPVSPTHFHNSVHNAAAGYWTIATGCMQSSTSLSAYDWSFSTGLLEAVTFTQVEGLPVLLVAYDYPPPFPLSEARPLQAPFATALLLSPELTTTALGELRLQLTNQGPEDQLDSSELERLRTGNPAARSLPLLQTIARMTSRTVTLPYLAGQYLNVEFSPCR